MSQHARNNPDLYSGYDMRESSAQDGAEKECANPTSLHREDHAEPSETEVTIEDGKPTGSFTCGRCGFIARWEMSLVEIATEHLNGNL